MPSPDKGRTVLERLLQLRFLVGALGERLGWWPGRFTSNLGLRHLSITFPRTATQAALRSVTQAARLAHDKSIHPDALHLFRLSPVYEDGIEYLLAQNPDRLDLPPEEQEEIIQRLESIGSPGARVVPSGSIFIGKTSSLKLHACIADLAQVYAAGARDGGRPLPYFKD